MARLVVVEGLLPRQEYELSGRELVLGRQPEVDVLLEAREVSRRHARITCSSGRFTLEDLDSSNGTQVNSAQLKGAVELQERDQIKIGPYTFRFELAPPEEGPVLIRAETVATPSNTEIFKQDPSRKLQAVLEIANQLGGTLNLDELLPKLLDHLLRLFPQSDRALLLEREGDHLLVRAVRSRRTGQEEGPPYSRTVARRILEEGIGIVAEDAAHDTRFSITQTLNRLGIRSFLCAPLKSSSGRVLGILQVDRFGLGSPFTTEDLNLLTAIAMQAALLLEVSSLHGRLIEQERLKRDLVLARQIQEGFLPEGQPKLAAGPVELFARVYPASMVSGDFYDYFPLDDQRLAFAVADVSGKGIPAAVFLTAVRTLCRHLAQSATSPAHMLQQLNDSLAGDNPTAMFVTMLFGVYDVSTGQVHLASGGHPPALWRHADGTVTVAPGGPGRLLGFAKGPLPLTDARLTLAPGEALLLYTDGLTEATGPDRKTMFETERLVNAFAGLQPGQPLASWSQRLRAVVELFAGRTELNDDLTLLFLRRPEAG
jgi:serine phosphatase RsbU (regulator of sigma subunit)/pSer/pThr/pTyr-binding forkhead associated (FHA) protein